MTEKQIRKITTSGKYSKAIILPREFLKKLNWIENQNLEVELDEKSKASRIELLENAVGED